MAEVQPRSQAANARGRGGGRGGRGGFAGRNTTARRANGDNTSSDSPALDDDSDIAQLRKQYGDSLATIKAIFADWSDADILYALKETEGDVELTATRIAEGTISQWGEVSKTKKPAARPKAKDSAPSTGPADTSSRPTRGGRPEGGRGARARGNERARGGGRGRATTHVTTNGNRAKEAPLSVPTEEASAWGNAITTADDANDWSTPAPATEPTTTDAPATAPAVAPAAATEPSTAPTTTASQGGPKTWASMLRQSTAPPKPAPQPKKTTAPEPAEVSELPASEPVAPEAEPEAEMTPKEVPAEPVAHEESPKMVVPEVALPPSEDNLTQVNLDLLPDESHPPATATAASTAADSWDPRQQPQHGAAVTPLSASQAQHQPSRASSSGYVATALKATERPTPRMPSYQRRLLEQEEAVRMPGNREVDRAAVQFGAFNLGGDEEDIDGNREDPETRAQPPVESPMAPRAALPAVALPPVAQPAPVPEAFPPAQKPAASQPQQSTPTVAPVAPPTGPAATTGSQASSGTQSFGRFPQPSAQEPSAYPQKPYDTFGQQTATTSAAGFDAFPAPTSQAPGPQSSGAFSSGPNDYSSYYAEQQRGNAYAGYYGYNQQQQGGQNHHAESNAANRTFGAYGSQNDNLGQYPQSASQQSRYPGATSAEAHNSGHNTPNPVGQTQQQQPSSAQVNQPQSNLHQQHSGFTGYQQHPYYSSPYYAQYMNQPYGGYGQGGYGNAPYGKGGYGQGHQYGMNPQGPFEHGSTTATGGYSQNSLSGRDSTLSSGMNDYGRGGAGQQATGPSSLGSAGFGGAHDSYGRGSGFPSQGGQSYNNSSAPTANAGSAADDLKPYGDSKMTGGPSPLAAAARPGSTTNATPAASGLPPPQSGQQGMGSYGGYPTHLSHNLHGTQTGTSGYGGLSGSGNQGHGNTPYGGGYGGNQGQGQGQGQSFGNYYGGGRQGHGGWGGNYN